MSHCLWYRVRRPFRYPRCHSCVWEVYDANQAGCLKCAKHHMCANNPVDCECPLVLCPDGTRVCSITGLVLPEIHAAAREYVENAFRPEVSCMSVDIDSEISSIIHRFLLGPRSELCRNKENQKQYQKIQTHMYKQLKQHKLRHPGILPNMCQILAASMSQEKHWRFIQAASEYLAQQCACQIVLCLLDLKAKGVKITSGARLQDLVCGMLYMLRTGLTYRNRVLLAAIPEIDACLPHENKIELYFGISSKVICMTENEVKLVFREYYQT